jgi:hypothetical protein
METKLQQQKQEFQTKEFKKEPTIVKVKKESDEAKINEVIFGYFTWLMMNSIEEFQTFYRFWNQQFIVNHRPF